MPSVPLQASIEIVDLSSRTPIIITNGGELCCSLPRARVKQEELHPCRSGCRIATKMSISLVWLWQTSQRLRISFVAVQSYGYHFPDCSSFSSAHMTRGTSCLMMVMTSCPCRRGRAASSSRRRRHAGTASYAAESGLWTARMHTYVACCLLAVVQKLLILLVVRVQYR